MKITGVLDLLSKTKYGMTSRGIPMYLLTPLNPDMPQLICGCSIKNPTKNILVVAEKVNDDKLPRGNILRYLGECGVLEAELRALEYAYTPNYWNSFPDVVEPSMEGKLVIDVEDTVNIDPEGCQDIDDCISFWEYRVAITIADVGQWILTNPWMKNAKDIGQTFYDNGTPVRKLFPHEYRMSLIPNEKRHGISLMFDFIGNNITNLRFQEVVIVNKKSYTYDSCFEWKYAKRLQKLAECIAEKTVTDPHDWIEQIMLFYNRQFATCLAETGLGLLRGHNSPDMEKVEHYAKIGLPKHLGYSAATYSTAKSIVHHWGLNSVYCHASSPIRRYADCVNQLAFKCVEVEDCSETLNKLQKYAKKFERDTKFAKMIQTGDSVLHGIIVNSKRVWCPELSCMITCPNSGYAGQRVDLEYFYNPNKPSWKTRVLFRVADTKRTSSPLQGQLSA